jgi:hypothetical protein
MKSAHSKKRPFPKGTNANGGFIHGVTALLPYGAHNPD